MTEKLKVGVFGTGALGRHHARLYHANPKAEVVGIFDVNRASAEKVAAEFGLTVFDDWKKLADACEAVSVAVPADFHGKSALPLLEMGKHVLIEKPLAATVAEGEAMVAAAQKQHVVFGTGHVERFNPAMDYLAAQAGKIRFVEARRLAKYPPARPGLLRRGTEVSVILDLMIHDLDLVLALIDSEVTHLDVFGTTVQSDSADLVTARLQFADGRAASVTASRIATEPMRQLQLFADSGIFCMDFGKFTGTVTRRGAEELVIENVTLPEKNALAAELDDFIDAVNRTKASGKVSATKVPAEAGLRALKLAAEIEAKIGK